MKLTPETCEIVLDSLEQSDEAFLITDANGTIVHANQAFGRLTGHTVRDVIGKNPNILKSGEHSAEFYAEMWSVIKSGRPWKGRLVNKKKDGSLYMEELRIYPVKDRGGVITNFMAVPRDNTEERRAIALRKKAEEESAKMREQMLQSQKMEALGLLAGQLSHDFNNLLTIIIGSMELIMEDMPKGSVTMKLAEGILQASKESATLIRQLLVFARRQEYVARVVNLNEIISETRILLDRLIGKNIKMTYDLLPDLAKVTMEPEQFKQALINLVINAKDAMPSGGAITIRTFNQPAAGGYAVVEVSDTGQGIPPEIKEHIFEPFFTTKPKGKGTGLGLSMVYGVVTQYKGEILVESRPGTDTVFTIRLPKAA